MLLRWFITTSRPVYGERDDKYCLWITVRATQDSNILAKRFETRPAGQIRLSTKSPLLLRLGVTPPDI